MSYNTPTEEDKEVLVAFENRLDKQQDRDSESNPKIDLIRIDFEFYLNPEEHTGWNAPFPPLSRDVLRELSESEKVEKIKQKSLESIQEKMENTALLSHIHNVELRDIEGLDQSPSTLKQRVQQARTDNQTKLADY